MCTARLFSRGVDLFALKFYVDRVIAHQPLILGIRKLEALGYPMVKTASLCDCVASFRHNTGV